jgi:hypothetical protein
VGLHIHGWKSLFEKSGVEFRSSPTFWGTGSVALPCPDDCGHEVPISAYSESELRKVVRTSLDVLERQGFGRPTTFRAGGWLATPTVQNAIRAEGLTTDSSAVPAQFLQPRLGSKPLYAWVRELWPQLTPTTQPFVLHTTQGDLKELPDNGALADYMSADQMIAVFRQGMAYADAHPGQSALVHIGFHQETAAQYLPRVRQALQVIQAELANLRSMHSGQNSVHSADACR